MTASIPRRLILSALGSGIVLADAIRSTAALSDTGQGGDIDQPGDPGDRAFIRRAFEMQRLAIEYGDQSYGAVVVMKGQIVGQSWSRVILDHDPTGHAEMSAIRDASRRLKNRNLSGAVLYSSSRPCPMCEAAAYWASVDQMIHGADASKAGPPKLCR